jgi:hypothetical protein
MLATKPFPRTGLQITIEKKSTDDLPCREKESERTRNYPPYRTGRKRNFVVTAGDPAAASANSASLQGWSVVIDKSKGS